MDYEDLFLYSNALVQDAESQILRTEVQRSSCPPEEVGPEYQGETDAARADLF